MPEPRAPFQERIDIALRPADLAADLRRNPLERWEMVPSLAKERIKLPFRRLDRAGVFRTMSQAPLHMFDNVSIVSVKLQELFTRLRGTVNRRAARSDRAAGLKKLDPAARRSARRDTSSWATKLRASIP